jgi:hypothetical protein
MLDPIVFVAIGGGLGAVVVAALAFVAIRSKKNRMM